METENNFITFIYIKYIVYCTTNLVNNKIYIGVHGTDNPEIFDGYLGNSLSTKDKYLMNHPKESFHFAVKKYGIKNFQRKTLAVFDTVEEALNLERQIVNEEFIRRKDTYNATLGGGLPPVYKKNIYQYDLEGNFIKEWTNLSEIRQFYGKELNIANSIKQGHACNGFQWSWEKVPFMKKLQNKSGRIRKVSKYDLNNNLIKVYNSVNEAKRENGSSVVNMLRGKQKTAKGYIYKYIEGEN